MIQRILKLISIPLVALLFLPTILISGIAFILTGKYHVEDLMRQYANYLYNS